jgi:hypothetical protein
MTYARIARPILDCSQQRAQHRRLYLWVGQVGIEPTTKGL